MASLMKQSVDLSLERVEIAALWSVQGNRETSLHDFENTLFGKDANIGSLLRSEPLSLLRLWPHQAYLLSDQQQIPADLQQFASVMTDIADGHCAFRPGGEQAFDFIAAYLSADLATMPAGPACLRCRLGHYVVILWWDDRRELQLLVERSCAQSFADYIDMLMARWHPEAP